MTIINQMPSQLVFAYSKAGYSKIKLQVSAGFDTDLTSIGVWSRLTGSNKSSASYQKFPYTSGALEVAGLVPNSSYTVSGAFLDSFVDSDPALVASQYNNVANTITITDLVISTKIAPTISTAVFNAGAIEIGSPVSRVDVTLTGTAETLRIEAKKSDESTWNVVYGGIFSNNVSINLEPGSYTLRCSGTISFFDGTIETSPVTTLSGSVVVGGALSAPTAPTGASVTAYKVVGSSTFYELDVNWNYSAGSGGAKRNFSVSMVDNPDGTAPASISEALWNAGRVEVSVKNTITLSPVAYRRRVALRIATDGWGTLSSSYVYLNVFISSDSADSTVPGYIVPTVRAAVTGTKVQVDDTGIYGYSVFDVSTPTNTKSSFKFDAQTGNVILGEAETINYPGGSVTTAPLIFDASTKRLQIDGHAITNKITAASYVMGWLSGESPTFSTANKLAYGDANSGIWMGYTGASTSDFKLDIGNSTQYIRWDGSALRISGQVIIDGGGSLSQLQKLVLVYVRSSTAPAVPAGGTFDAPTPAGWSLTIPAGTNPVYMSFRTFTSDGAAPQDANWSTPSVFAVNGATGAAAVSGYLSNEASVVGAATNGTGYSLTNSGGSFKVFSGTTDVTSSATLSIVGGTGTTTLTKVQNGLTLSLVESTGVYTLSGASWTTDTETFTMRAVYSGVTIDKVYTISKSKTGATGATGAVGAVGGRGAGFWNYTTNTSSSVMGLSSAAVAALFANLGIGSAVTGDQLVLANTLNESAAYRFVSPNWTDATAFINGDLIVSNSIGSREISTQDLFAQTITLPDGGVIRAGTTTYAEMGGDGYFTAQADTETIFKIGKNNDHFINGSHISQTLPWQAFDGSVIPYIREQLALGTPSAGGSIAGSETLTSAGVTVTTTGPIPSAGANSAITVATSYGGYSTRLTGGEVGPQIPQVSVQLYRIVNDGTPVAIGALTTKSGSVLPAEPLGGGLYQWTVRVPGFNVSLSDASPGVGNIKYRAVVTIANPPANQLGTVNLSASQAASGSAGTVSWSSILDKPNLSLVGHTHSAAEVGAIAIGGAAGSITGFNNPTAAATANTIAYRDGSADILARLFRSNHPAEGYFPAGSALAFRSDSASDNYIRFCSDPAAIRNWVGANNASNLTSGTLDDARLPGIFSKKTFLKNAITSGSGDSHLELRSSDIGGGGDIALMFHQENRWYHSIRANANGFRFTNGGSNNLERLTAGAYYFGDNGGNMGAGAGSSMRVQTPTGYVDVGSTNAGWAHFSTDRPGYCFNRSIHVDGDLQIYNTGTGFNSLGLFWDSGATTLYKLATGAISIGTINSGAVDKMLHFGYTPVDGYGFRFLHQGHASNAAAGTFSLQRGLVNGWANVLTVDNAGGLFLNDGSLYLRGNGDYNHGIAFNSSVNGPEIKGYYGGRLASSQTGNIALRWDQNGYVWTGSWVNIPNDNGIFWNNGTHLLSVGNGKLKLFGGGNESWIMLCAGGEVPRGYLYADVYNNIGFLSQFGYWSFRLDSGSNAYANDFIATSDRRIKSELEVIPNALDKVSKMTGYTYMKKGNDKRRQAGYIAQDLQAVLPEGVFEYDDVLQVSNSATIGLLLNAVNELAAEVKALKRRLH